MIPRFPVRAHLGALRRLHSARDASQILSQARSQASVFGVDPSVAYEPAVPVDLFQSSAAYLRDSFNLSWPEALLSLGALFRTVTFPLYVASIRKGRRRSEAAQELAELRDMAKEAVLLRDENLVRAIDRE